MPSGTSTNYEWNDIQLSVTRGTHNTPHDISLVRIVRRKNQADINPITDWAGLESESVIATVDQAYTNGGTWHAFARCRSVNITKESGTQLRVVMQFNSVATYREGILLFPAYTTYSTRARQLELYRREWTTNPSDVLTTADIGGINTAPGGDPMIGEIAQVLIRANLTINASSVGVVSYVAPLRDLVGKVNSASFYGFGAGTVVCEGFAVNPVAGMTEIHDVTVDFVYDPYFHAVQVPDREADGRPVLNGAGVANPGAKVVKWTRQSRATADFNTIFADANIKTLAQNGWWS